MDCIRDYLKSYELGHDKESLCSAVRVAAEHGIYNVTCINLFITCGVGPFYTCAPPSMFPCLIYLVSAKVFFLNYRIQGGLC